MGDILGMITQIFYDLWVSFGLPTKDDDQATFLDYLHPDSLVIVVPTNISRYKWHRILTPSAVRQIFGSRWGHCVSKTQVCVIKIHSSVPHLDFWQQYCFLYNLGEFFFSSEWDMEQVEWPLWSLSVETKIKSRGDENQFKRAMIPNKCHTLS